MSVRKLLGKIKSRRGETLLEALVAILVIVFSGLTLYFSVITSARVNKAASVADDAFRTQTGAAEQQAGVSSTGKVTITAPDGKLLEADVDYTGADGELASYKLTN